MKVYVICDDFEAQDGGDNYGTPDKAFFTRERLHRYLEDNGIDEDSISITELEIE